MSDKPAPSLNDHLDPDGPTEPGYEAWVRRQIEDAIADARANPDADSSIEEVRAHFEAKFAARV